jgi:hypothetical protein
MVGSLGIGRSGDAIGRGSFGRRRDRVAALPAGATDEASRGRRSPAAGKGGLIARQIQHPDVVYTALEDDAVLLNLETASYYSLNEVGTTVWQLLESTENHHDLIERLTAEYDVERERAESSVSDFLQQLEREQLVVRDPEDEARPKAERRNEGSGVDDSGSAERKPFAEPLVLKHDEPLHEVVMNPFDPQLPLAE